MNEQLHPIILSEYDYYFEFTLKNKAFALDTVWAGKGN